MMFIKQNDIWLELDRDRMEVFGFSGGFHNITEEQLQSCEIVECENWRELYLQKGYCPLEVTVRWHDVWISPEGKFYNGEAHENRAEEILEIMYGETDIDWHGDRLEELGWVRASASLMWEVRGEKYWKEKDLTQKQYDALWNWCQLHKKLFPQTLRNTI